MKPVPTARTSPVDTRLRWRDQLVAMGWLVLVWNLLWGEFSVGNLLGGALVAAVVLTFFPLPPVSFGGRIRPVAVLRFFAHFVVDLVVASFHVAQAALRPGYVPKNAIIGVRLRVRSDLNLTLTAEALSLVPGSLIVETDRGNGTLYVHVLDVRGPDAVAAARRSVYELEARIVRAIGSAAELRMLAVDPEAPEPPAAGTEPDRPRPDTTSDRPGVGSGHLSSADDPPEPARTNPEPDRLGGTA